MKYLNRLLSLLILVSAVIVLTNCGGSDDPVKSEQQTQFEKLKFQWTLQSVTADEPTAADQFDNNTTTLTITGSFNENGTYNYVFDPTTQVDASPWPHDGLWKFGSPVSNTIIRLDTELGSSEDVTMTYLLSNSDKTLQVTINDYNGGPFVAGKSASVDGDWTFVFTRP